MKKHKFKIGNIIKYNKWIGLIIDLGIQGNYCKYYKIHWIKIPSKMILYHKEHFLSELVWSFDTEHCFHKI
jgi:hypothetical protein